MASNIDKACHFTGNGPLALVEMCPSIYIEFMFTFAPKITLKNMGFIPKLSQRMLGYAITKNLGFIFQTTSETKPPRQVQFQVTKIF